MQLNSTLAQMLEAYELERLTALVNWLEPDTAPLHAPLPAESQTLESSPLKEESIMSTLTPSRPSSTAITLNELIEFSILNEFGSSFQNKTCFEWLRECLTRRFNQDASIR